jgi:hypothetical protein
LNKRNTRRSGRDSPAGGKTRHVGNKEGTSMSNFTVSDFILLIPMALAGALFLGALPTSSRFLHNVLRVLGALIGVVFAVVLVEGLPVLM